MNEPTDTTPKPLFRTTVAIRWGDMDAFKHVNNARYLTYLEQARLAWFDELGDPSWLGPRCAPIMAAAQVNYRKPITWPECSAVEVELVCQRLGHSSVTVGHRIRGAAEPGTLYCDGHVVLVWIDPTSGKPIPLPDVIRQAARYANAP